MTTLELPPYPLTEQSGPGVDGDPDEVLLVVGDWRSRCSACGGEATITEVAHSTRIGATEPENGCGRRFTAVACDAEAVLGAEVAAGWIAEDLGLPYVGRRPWPRRGGAA